MGNSWPWSTEEGGELLARPPAHRRGRVGQGRDDHRSRKPADAPERPQGDRTRAWIDIGYRASNGR